MSVGGREGGSKSLVGVLSIPTSPPSVVMGSSVVEFYVSI